jgi:DNA invertase Pin-like site-specific DNA recombinase
MMAEQGTIGIVVRVSDVRGRDKRGDRFISPDEQVRHTSAHCRASGYAVQVIEPMDLNVSHTTPLDERPAMSEALRLVEAGALAGIGAASQDRIGPLVLTRELKARLLAAGAVLKVADNPTAELLDARGYLKLPSETMSLVHEAQREEIGLRWEAAKRNARERGVLPQREPYGYERADDGRVAVCEPHAAEIREAFRLRAAGVPFAAIGRRFGWSHSTARQRLANPVYDGRNPLLPAIVTQAEFEAAQAGRTTRPIPPGETTRDLLLQGIARCAGCGRTLKHVRRSRADGSYVPAYYCKDAASTPCPERAYVHCADLDDLVADWFTNELRGTHRLVDVVTAARELDEAQAELEEAERELVAFVETASALMHELFQRGLDVRQARVDKARGQIHELSGRVIRLPAGGSLLGLWERFTPRERRDVLAGFLDRIEVSRGANADLASHVRIYWSDGTLAEIPHKEIGVRVAAA